MRCPSCGTEGAASAKFCTECGGALKRLCQTCGAENPAAARFCGACATRLDAVTSAAAPTTFALSLDRPIVEAVPDGERKLVTALFADIKGSVELMSELDPEDAQALVDPALRLMVEAVDAHEGYVVQTTGDGIFALFGAPAAYQDHPRRGIHAALEMQRALHAYAARLARQGKPPITVRVGINTGEAVVRVLATGARVEYNTIGHAVNFAARLQSASPPGSIAIGEQTARLVEGYFELRPLPPMAVKGIARPVSAYEVVGAGPLRRYLQLSMRRGLSKFVGRDREMGVLDAALRRALAGNGQIVATVTDAGVGKSRLLYEFSRTLPAECRLVDAYALSHGRAIPWMPVIELLQGYFGIRSADDTPRRRGRVETILAGLDPALLDAAPYLFGLLGIGEEADLPSQMDPQVRRQRLIDALRQIVLLESRRAPLVLIFEDLHWADLQTRLLLDALADSIESARVLLLVTYRPEYDSQWSDRPHYTEIRLEPLRSEDAEHLLNSLLPEAPDLVPFKRFIIEKTAGNPFFIEEIIHALFADGVLVRDGPTIRLTKPLGALRLPQTVQGTLAERIDKLSNGHKQLLQLLAVIGLRLPMELIRVAGDWRPAQLLPMLSELQAADFIYPLPGRRTRYAFKHVLTQEVAYNSLLSERRRQLHERVATAMEAIYTDNLGEYVSELAFHYSRTGNTHKAIDYLGLAGEHAVQRSAHAEAAENLEAALRLIETLPETPERTDSEARLWLALGSSLLTSRGYAAPEVGAAYERAEQLAERSGDAAQIVAAIRGRFLFSTVRADYRTVHRLGERLLPLDDDTREHAAERRMIMAMVSLYTGRFAAAADYFREAVTPEGDNRPISTIQYIGHTRALCFSYSALDLWFLGYPERSLQHSQEGFALGQRLAIPMALAQAQGMYGLVAIHRRDYAVAEEWIGKTVAYAGEQGFPYWYTLGSLLHGHIMSHNGEQQAGLAQFDEHLQNYRLSGARIGVPWFLAMRAQMLGDMGQLQEGLLVLDEALSLVEETDERYYEAEIHHLQGDLLLRMNGCASVAEAETCFQRSLRAARRQAAKSFELRAATSLARLRAQQGREAEGLGLLGAVYGWFTEGFDTPDLRDARRVLDELRGSEAPGFGHNRDRGAEIPSY